MRRLPALVAALLLPAAQPVLLGTAISVAALLVAQAPALAQSAEAVARIAEAITVRIEGATQGSGVLVKRDGNRYTVLTAWNVVSGQRPGEELDVYTPDGQRHKVEQGSIKRLGEVDMAVLSFSSPSSYEVAPVGDVKSISSGSAIYVAGFPLPTSAGPTRIWQFLDGKVIANAIVAIPNGYQLLYSNQTLPGMSGGAVMNAQGQLVGIHVQGEIDGKKSEQEGIAWRTGTAVPIAYYSQYSAGVVVVSYPQAISADDYLAQARALLGKKGSDQEVIRLANQVLATRQSAEAYFFRGFAKDELGDKKAAIADLSEAIAINSNYALAYNNRGKAKSDLGDKRGALVDYDQATAINPRDALFYYNRGCAKYDLGNRRGAISDFNIALLINPKDADAFSNRGVSKSDLGDKQGAIADYDQAIAINPRDAVFYNNRGLVKHDLGDQQGAIGDYNKSIALNPQFSSTWRNRGDTRSVMGDKQGAIADYNRAIAINPRLPYAWASRGVVKYQLGDRYGACKDVRKAASLGHAISRQFLPKFCP